MTARTKEAVRRYELIERVLQDIREMSDDGAVIVVEGRNDESTLRNLGICGAIESPGGQSLLHFTDSLASNYDSVIVLTDWDRRGNQLSAQIVRYLQSRDVAIDTDLRSRLKKLVQKDIKDVQGIKRHILKLRQNIIKYIK
uniref:Ribonuclease M5 n=1 Tax=Candidatus Methanogaster sp. ANME-2c ERB4 TaxID=2759911 RepID=A0A7G9YFY0_9EURY|nr:ribonuclease M5 [Methanosarcinales archaeon ANME-2c ERB4]